MHLASRVALLVSLAACSKKPSGDECQQFVDKSRSVIEKMGEGKRKPTDADFAGLVAKCRASKDKPENKDAEMMKCVLAANGDAAVSTCWEASLKDYMSKSKMTEARLQLNKLSKNLKIAYATDATFPKGAAGPTPADACCKEPNKGKCAVTDAWAKDPTWSALDFSIDEPNLFQYTYTSDGTSAVATAVGDLDCDGTSITYKLVMAAKDGVPQMSIEEPAPSSD